MSNTMFLDTSNFDLLTHCDAVITHEEWLEASNTARGNCMGPFSDEVLARRDGSWFYIDPADLRHNNWDGAHDLTHLGWLACERVHVELLKRDTSMGERFAVKIGGGCTRGPATGVRG